MWLRENMLLPKATECISRIRNVGSIISFECFYCCTNADPSKHKKLNIGIPTSSYIQVLARNYPICFAQASGGSFSGS